MTREQAIELMQERVKVCESYKGIVKDPCIEEYKEALLIAIEDMREAAKQAASFITRKRV